MSRLGATVLGVAMLSGCSYYNTLHNSELLYEEAEALRLAGQDSLAATRYQDVIRKTSDAYRGRPDGDQAAPTLLLLGRAQRRAGHPREAEAALDRAASLAREPELRSRILVDQAFASADLGEHERARALLDEALLGGLQGRVLGDAYLLRGRMVLAGGNRSEGWDDLDRAAIADPLVWSEAGVEGLRWSVHHRDLGHARSALARLLIDPRGGERLDTISALVSAAAERWSPSVAATMLGEVSTAAWDGAARSRLILQQAQLLHRAEDDEAAEERAWDVARGRGGAMADARVMLAGWTLERARDLGEAQSVVPILLPAGEDPRATALLDAVEAVERYSALGLEDPLGWFAAAEVARDRLGAPVLARGLFLAYADTDPTDRWAPKALLAALDVSLDPDDRSWLRGRLEAHRSSPYVEAARGGSAAGFEALEEQLRVRLTEIATR